MYIYLPLSRAHMEPTAAVLITFPTSLNSKCRGTLTWVDISATIDSCSYSELPQPNRSPFSNNSQNNTKSVIVKVV